MRRVVCNVATDSWVVGQQRLCAAMKAQGEEMMIWSNRLPAGCLHHRDRGLCAGPAHSAIPYAFKPVALKAAADAGADMALWCDASIVPVRSLEPLWARIERDGYWMSHNGWNNYQWTADSAYPDLFPGEDITTARKINRQIPHVVATAFGLNLRSLIGAEFLAEYFRLASTTRAFCGPWGNSNAPSVRGRNADRPCAPCGPPDVLGHRHDQVCASVIAWRLGFALTEPPAWFAYHKAGDPIDERTVLIAGEL